MLLEPDHLDITVYCASGHVTATTAEWQNGLREIASGMITMVTEVQTPHLRSVVKGFADNHNMLAVLGGGHRNDDLALLVPAGWSIEASGHVQVTGNHPYVNALTGHSVPAHKVIWAVLVHDLTGVRILVIGVHLPPGVDNKWGGGFAAKAPRARKIAWRLAVRRIKRLSRRLRRVYEIDRKHELILGDWNVWFVRSKRLLKLWPAQRLYGADKGGMAGFDGVMTGAQVLAQHEKKKPKGWDHFPHGFRIRIRVPKRRRK